MPKRVKFHLDENVNSAVAKGLRRRGIDVTTTSEVNLLSASDMEQLAFGKPEDRVIFTQDDDFLRLDQLDERLDERHAGIVYCRKGSRSTGEIIQALCLIYECISVEEMVSRLEFI